MRVEVELPERMRDLARRAGLEQVPPAVVGVAVLALVLALGYGAWRWWPRGSDSLAVEATAAPQAASAPVSAPATGAVEAAASEATPTAEVRVHVVGSVRRPGVYSLAPGARVIDAIEAAGGMIGDAAQQAVNLARPVGDGEQILVPTRSEWEANGSPAAVGAGVGPIASGSGGQPMAGGTSVPGTPGAPVDINTADAAALDALPGVGPSTAQKIIADREANGPFATPEDLGRVAGIGPKKLDALKGLITVR